MSTDYLLLPCYRYDMHSLHAYLDASGQFQQCHHEGCSSGQMFFADKDSFIVCAACDRRTCVKCNVPWHTDSSCDEFQAARNAEATSERLTKQSEEYIDRECKLCPKCKAPGKKEDGCDHIVCMSCARTPHTILPLLI